MTKVFSGYMLSCFHSESRGKKMVQLRYLHQKMVFSIMINKGGRYAQKLYTLCCNQSEPKSSFFNGSFSRLGSVLFAACRVVFIKSSVGDNQISAMVIP